MTATAHRARISRPRSLAFSMLVLWLFAALGLAPGWASAAPGEDDDTSEQSKDDDGDDDGGPSEDMPGVRRFALVVGANDGGNERVPLQFAGTDAHAVATVLKDIGGVRSEDLIELSDPTPDELDSAFAAMSKRLRAAAGPGVRLQLVFYYSGHSDEQGLLLGAEQIKYPALRSKVQSTPADVKIAILDSCASGAFTRLKGGKKTAPFLVGSAAAVEGHAFLTSSSADEAAQESDRVGGSFFTHYLTTGLRGAADVDKNRIVTLNEAYQFAFDETLARTEATRGGPQHAAYDIQLAGTGDLVMTDLRRTSARLEIMEDVGGRIFVHSGRGHLAAELYKPEGSGPVLLALESGHYQITVDDGETLRRADVTLAEGLPAQITSTGLFEIQREGTVSRGAPPVPGPIKTSEYDEIPFNVGLFPPLSINGQSGKKRIRNSFSIAMGWTRAARVDGVQVAMGAAVVDEEIHGLQGAFGAAISRNRVEGWQLAMAYNSAKSLVGAQTGLVNYAENVETGAQIGMVNVGGKVKGVQIGLVNWAQEADASIGLIAATKEHGLRPEVWTSDAALVNVGLRFGAKHTYSFLTAGMHPYGAGKGWLFGFGVGARAKLGERFALDFDLIGHAYARGLVVRDTPSGMGTFRITFAWQALPRLAVFGGPTVRALIDPQTERTGLTQTGLGYTAYDDSTPDLRVRVWPGFAAGLRF